MSTLLLISGSHRPQGNSGRIARVIESDLNARGHAASVLDLSALDLPFWDEGMWGANPLDEKWQKLWQPLATQIEAAEGFVIVVPEYHGMVPSKLKNFLLLLGNGALAAHKPALLVSVSAGPTNGAYPIAELRATGGKNNRLLFIPEHLIIRHAGEMLHNTPKPEHAGADATLRERLAWGLTLLEDYIEPMKSVRAAGHTLNPKFANGM